MKNISREPRIGDRAFYRGIGGLQARVRCTIETEGRKHGRSYVGIRLDNGEARLAWIDQVETIDPARLEADALARGHAWTTRSWATDRLQVDGGWLYRHGGQAPVFVEAEQGQDQ